VINAGDTPIRDIRFGDLPVKKVMFQLGTVWETVLFKPFILRITDAQHVFTPSTGTWSPSAPDFTGLPMAKGSIVLNPYWAAGELFANFAVYDGKKWLTADGCWQRAWKVTAPNAQLIVGGWWNETMASMYANDFRTLMCDPANNYMLAYADLTDIVMILVVGGYPHEFKMPRPIPQSDLPPGKEFI
jgi:hypothetical protein